MNLADVPSLPTILDGHKTAELLGCSYWHLLELVKRGDAPVEPLRLGRRLVWPTARVLEVLGLDRDRGPVMTPGPVTSDITPTSPEGAVV